MFQLLQLQNIIVIFSILWVVVCDVLGMWICLLDLQPHLVLHASSETVHHQLWLSAEMLGNSTAVLPGSHLWNVWVMLQQGASCEPSGIDQFTRITSAIWIKRLEWLTKWYHIMPYSNHDDLLSVIYVWCPAYCIACTHHHQWPCKPKPPAYLRVVTGLFQNGCHEHFMLVIQYQYVIFNNMK